jgi:hypothetical protein
MKALRSSLVSPRSFDAVVVLLMSGIVLSAYIDAYAHVKVPGTILKDYANGAAAGVTVSWFLVTGFLFLFFGRGLRQGRPWNHALPDGYTGSLAAALVFGAALIADTYWPDASGSSTLGLDLLFKPPHVVEMAATAVMVSGPLRAAARRGEATAGVVTLISAALLLSVFTFATQFLHPLIDPWSSSDPQQIPTPVATWVARTSVSRRSWSRPPSWPAPACC